MEHRHGGGGWCFSGSWHEELSDPTHEKLLDSALEEFKYSSHISLHHVPVGAGCPAEHTPKKRKRSHTPKTVEKKNKAKRLDFLRESGNGQGGAGGGSASFRSVLVARPRPVWLLEKKKVGVRF